MADTFYDNTPFEYGYSSKEEILENMNPNLKEIIIENKDKIICDIGCGCGRNLVFTSKYASKLIGVDLSEESLVKILKEPKNSLIKQYQQIFRFEGVKLTFKEEAL